MAGELRSPRKRAEEIGTEAGGLDSAPPYDPTAGAPDAGGTYQELEPQVTDGAKPHDTPTPFSNMKG